MAKQTRGKRYSAQEKKAILSFVTDINNTKGRGGVSAAHKKYGVSQLTVSSWLKKAGLPTKVRKAGRPVGRPAGVSNSGGFGGNLRRLADLHDEITATKKQLAALEAEFAKLKKKL